MYYKSIEILHSLCHYLTTHMQHNKLGLHLGILEPHVVHDVYMVSQKQLPPNVILFSFALTIQHICLRVQFIRFYDSYFHFLLLLLNCNPGKNTCYEVFAAVLLNSVCSIRVYLQMSVRVCSIRAYTCAYLSILH